MSFQRLLQTCVVCLAFGAFTARGQITINGVADRQTAANSITFTVVAQAGWTYWAWLNANSIPVGVAVTVNRPDFYQLVVTRSNDTTSAVQHLLRRFIVFATERGATENTELGLPPHTPWPVIQSVPEEFEGGQLRVIVPQDFPAGYEIPVVAWVVDANGHAIRANGLLASGGQRSIQLRRGVGAALLTSNNPPGVLNYTPSVGGLTTNKPINLEAATSWSSVSGTLAGTTTWADNARIRVTGHLTIPAGSTLTIEAGAIVLLNSGVNITNNGSVLINGTLQRPVVFMPNSTNQPWGGFFMRTSTGVVDGTGVLFTGSGADPNGGAGHRDEQCLFFVDSTPRVTLADAAAFDLKGQLGHANNGGTFTFDRFLLQRCTTGGEYTGARFTATDSAFIECPDASANFVNGDNDALYFINAPGSGHGFTNTLFGWTKDDGVDSGGSGYGPLSYQSCWFEAIFHEGNSLSGFKNTRAWDTVYLDCGQGIEDGYDAPTGRVDRCLFVACKSGVRHGDNYQTFSGYDGLMVATNCISIFNHRDLFGYNWDNQGGWTNNWGRMIAIGNFISRPDTNFPNNTIWNPASDGWRLTAFGAKGRAGVALAVRPGQNSFASFLDGVPVGLSMFCTNVVTVGYTLLLTDGPPVQGTVTFPPGSVHEYIPLPTGFTGAVRVTLANPVNADITGLSELFIQNFPSAASTTFFPFGSGWKYLDDGSNQGTAWRDGAFSDLTWSNGIAELGFGDSPADETTFLRRTNTVTGATNITFYFRKTFVVADPAAFGSVTMTLKRDDGGVVYINGTERFRSVNMPGGAINYNTLATATGENSIDTTNLPPAVLQAGTNLIAVEIHQQALSSSDVSFDLSLVGQPAPPAARVHVGLLGDRAVLYWSDGTFQLEQSAEIVNPSWSPSGSNSPVAVPPSGARRFFRLKK